MGERAEYGDDEIIDPDGESEHLAASILWMLEHPHTWLVDGDGVAWKWDGGTFVRCCGDDWASADGMEEASPAGEGGIVLPCRPLTRGEGVGRG